MFACPSWTLSDLSAEAVSHASAGRKDGSPSKKIDLVAIHHERHQEYCENMSTLSRKATEPGTGAGTCPRGSLLPIPLPDLVSYKGRQFLILTDQFSGFPHICECGKHVTTKQVTNFITLFITMYSALVVIYSDGGPQFRDEFDNFCKKWSIKHIKSSPHYPQSNGVAELAVKEMKKIIRAVFDNKTRTLDKSGLAAAMLMLRNTPRSPTDLSPAQLVFGRNLTDAIPFSRQMLRPQNRYQIEKRQLVVRENQRHKNHSSKGRKLPLLRPGQRVRFQDPIWKKWTLTGKVTGFGEIDRDYWVKDDNKAHRYRRNRRIIKPIEVEAVRPPVQPVQAPPVR